MALDEREALTDRPLLVRSLIVLALVTVAFALHGVLHYEPSVVALLGAGLLLLVAGRDLQPFLREVEWPTLAFFAGLFIMVGALIKTGVIAQLAEAVAAATGGARGWEACSCCGRPGCCRRSSTTSPMWPPWPRSSPPWSRTSRAMVMPRCCGVAGVGRGSGRQRHRHRRQRNGVILGLAQRAGQPIRFLAFTRYGAVVAVATMLVCVPYLWLRYFVLG